MLSRALATGSDTVRSPNGLSDGGLADGGLAGADVEGADVVDGDAAGDDASDATADRGLRLRRRRGGRSTAVGADELDPFAGEGGVPRATAVVLPWRSEGVWPGLAEACGVRFLSSAVSFRLTASSMGGTCSAMD